MSDNRTSPLVLDAMIVPGDMKAAIKAAGGGSSDLWTVPPEHIHYDPRDNVRPLDKERVRRIADLIKANGYDRKKPLGCFVRKIGGEDRIFVYEGQHRYHAALLAIEEGYKIERLPLVIDAAKTVTRTNLIYAGIINNDSEKLTPFQMAERIVELQALGESNKTICGRLNITDQTIRDCLLLANAPTAIHKLVREQAVTSTLAIEQIRTHGAEKAVERLQRGVESAKLSGKAKATKKHVEAASAAPAVFAPKKISETQAKQLLQALQSVLHDPAFGKLSSGTITGVHTALTPLVDLLDTPSRKNNTVPDVPGPKDVVFVDELNDPIEYPLHTTNSHGVFDQCERIEMPRPPKHRGLCPAEITLAHPQSGSWIFATSYATQKAGRASWPSVDAQTIIYPSRFKALQAARDHLIEQLSTADMRGDKLRSAILKWLDDIYMAEHSKLLAATRSTAKQADKGNDAGRRGLHPAAAWPFPTGAKP